MNTKNTDKIEAIKSALRSAGHFPFRTESGYPKYDAQRNLQGRTHYVDDDTLRSFKARILTVMQSPDGLLYGIVESVGSKPYDSRKNKRAVLFDVFGTVLSERDAWRATSATAQKELAAMIADFDTQAHYCDTMEKLAKRAESQAAEFRAAIA